MWEAGSRREPPAFLSSKAVSGPVASGLTSACPTRLEGRWERGPMVVTTLNVIHLELSEFAAS